MRETLTRYAEQRHVRRIHLCSAESFKLSLINRAMHSIRVEIRIESYTLLYDETRAGRVDTLSRIRYAG